MKSMKVGYFIFCLCFCLCLHSADIDLVIFSYNRPMQLYAFLESLEMQVTGLRDTTVIYRTSSPSYEEGYAIVKRDFPHVFFKQQQHERASADFKPLVLESAFSRDSLSGYILFAVDDIVMTRSVDLCLAAEVMDREGAYACFFRLGLDIDHCYMLDERSGLPPFKKVAGEYFSWQFEKGKGDWMYPNNVDFTMYRKQEVFPFFFYAPYTFPNDLEAYWARLANLALFGICPPESCMVNIPMNVVSSFCNRQMNYKSAEELLTLFMQGYKMDVSALQGREHNSPHFPITPTFILRGSH